MGSPSVARLAAEFELALVRVDGVRAVYIFGSAVASDTPRDLDLLVVYGPPLVPATAPSLGPLIERAVAAVCSLPVHLILFSEAEAREPGLVDGLQPLQVLLERPVG
jgi:predicted nucleotidyltransferase